MSKLLSYGTRPFIVARPWITPSGLLAGHLAHAVAWLMLATLTSRDWTGPSLRGIAWIHLVALGWVTLTALTVLLYVIPQFTEIAWRFERAARVGLVAFAVGAFALVAAFWSGRAGALAWSATVLAAGLTAYLATALATLAAATRGPRTEAAIARALAIVALFLAAAAALGLVMAWALAGRAPASWLVNLPAAHAHLAGLGWLTTLVMGVSVRTAVPILGVQPATRWRHITSATLVTLATLLLAGALWSSVTWLLRLGVACAAGGIVLYAVDVSISIARARVTHRPPQVLLGACLFWLLVAVGLGIGVAAGARWEAAYVFVALVGWVGQAVIAHLHHIGVRLIATVRRGEDDETPPSELLVPALSWATVAAFQSSVAIVTLGLLGLGLPWVRLGAWCGLLAWTTMTINFALALYRA